MLSIICYVLKQDTQERIECVNFFQEKKLLYAY